MDLTFSEKVRCDVGHPWVRTENGQALLGVTNLAQRRWGQVEFAELPAAGKRLSAGAPFGQRLCADAGPVGPLLLLSLGRAGE